MYALCCIEKKNNSLAGNSHLFLMLCPWKARFWEEHRAEWKWSDMCSFWIIPTQTSRNPIASFEQNLSFSHHMFSGRYFNRSCLALRSAGRQRYLHFMQCSDAAGCLWPLTISPFLSCCSLFPTHLCPFTIPHIVLFFCFSFRSFLFSKEYVLCILILYHACKV